MPHAEPKRKTNMGEPIVNGEKPHYKSLSVCFLVMGRCPGPPC